MKLSGSIALVCDGPLSLARNFALAQQLTRAGITVHQVPVQEDAACGHALWQSLVTLDRQHPLDVIDLPGGPHGLRLVQARRAGLGLDRARLIVRQAEPAILVRAPRQQWIASPWDPLLDHAERFVFEHADVQLFETPNLARQLRDLGWAVSPTAGPAPTHNLADLYAGYLATRPEKPLPARCPLVSIVAPADAFPGQGYPHLEYVSALAEAHGDYVLVPPPDCRPFSSLVEALVRALERHPDSAAILPGTRWKTPAGDLAIVPIGGPRWLAGLPHVLGNGVALYRRDALVDLAGDPLLALLARGRTVDVYPVPLVTRHTDGDPLAIPRDFPLLPLACLSPRERHELWGMLMALVQTDFHPLVERERLLEEEKTLRAELATWPHRLVDWLDPLFRLVPQRAKSAVRGWLQQIRRWFRRSA
jgi:hypothetical protein